MDDQWTKAFRANKTAEAFFSYLLRYLVATAQLFPSLFFQKVYKDISAITFEQQIDQLLPSKEPKETQSLLFANRRT